MIKTDLFKERIPAFCIAIVLSVVFALGVSATQSSTAYASSITTSTTMNANWEIPTTIVTNTVWKDADGNVVDANTPGATQYKVITSYGKGAYQSGADYLGISNSNYFGDGQNGNASISTARQAEQTSSVGVWASKANENANAYQWNSFFNLYQTQGVLDGIFADKSDWAASSSNDFGSNGWDTEAGVFGGLKYRPEIIFNAGYGLYINYINDGIFASSAKLTDDKLIPNTQDGDYAQYHAPGDRYYNPHTCEYSSAELNNCFNRISREYEIAKVAQEIIDDTADYSGLDSGETLDWKTVNELPRSTRYSETPEECACNIEMLTKGSIYYTLGQIAAGNVDKKKVAYVVGGSNSKTTINDSSSIITNEDQVLVAVFINDENLDGVMDGRAGITPLVVDQLAPSGSKNYIGTVADGSCTLYYASADDIASCDVVYCSPDVTFTEANWQDWIGTYATSGKLKDSAGEISYLTTWPILTDGSDVSMENIMYSLCGLEFIYPELFPSKELSCFWCDKVYHLNDKNITSAMSWIYSTSTLPSGTVLSNIPAQYDEDDLYAKFYSGLQHYLNNCNNNYELVKYTGNIKYFEPSSYWIDNVVYPDADCLFKDVATGDWYTDAVQWAYNNGVITGYGPDYTRFGVGDTITRADFVTTLWRWCESWDYANYDESSAVNETSLPDVVGGQYWTGAANWAYENGVITGYQLADGTYEFAPYDPVTFEQLITMLGRYRFGYDGSEFYDSQYIIDSLIPSPSQFRDINKVSDWAIYYMACFIADGYVTGNNNGDGTYTIAPLEDVARERAVTVMYRLFTGKGVTTLPSVSVDTLLSRAEAQLGKPYVWGAAGPDSFDCSGLVSYCITGRYEHTWSTVEIIQWSEVSTPEIGDICVVHQENGDQHCGIHIGSDGLMINANSVSGVCTLTCSVKHDLCQIPGT